MDEIFITLFRLSSLFSIRIFVNLYGVITDKLNSFSQEILFILKFLTSKFFRFLALLINTSGKKSYFEIVLKFFSQNHFFQNLVYE